MKSALVAALAVLLMIDVAAQSRGRGATSSKAPATTAVRVTVRDQAGDPLADTRLALSGDGAGEFVTGALGTAMLPDLKDGTYRVRVERRGFFTLEREFALRAGAPKAIDVALTPEPPAPPPPPPPPPTAPKTLPPPGPPVTMSIVDFIDKNFIGKEPATESVLACASLETVRLLQIRETVASHAHADADEVLCRSSETFATRLSDWRQRLGQRMHGWSMEIENAINQAKKELLNRFDFKGSKASIEFKRAEAQLLLTADSDFQMKSLFDVVQTRLIKRHVSVKNLDVGEIQPAGNDTVRREIKLKTALDSDTAKKVAGTIKNAKLKKVQAAIQGEQVRVSSPSKDDLQDAMNLLRGQDFGVELKFGNYR